MKFPIVIRWRKLVEREARERESLDKLKTRRIVLMMAENIKLRKVLHRWGLDEGVYGSKAKIGVK